MAVLCEMASILQYAGVLACLTSSIRQKSGISCTMNTAVYGILQVHWALTVMVARLGAHACQVNQANKSSTLSDCLAAYQQTFGQTESASLQA